MRKIKFIFNICLILSIAATNLLYAQRVELKDKRSFFSSTYRTPDDNFETVISPAPVHYLDRRGEFHPIKRDIVPSNSEYDFEVVEGFYHAYFKSDLLSDYPVVFESKDGANLKMKLTAVAYLDIVSKNYHVLQNIQSSTPVVSGNKIAFSNVFNNIDLKYYYGDTRLKEEIWLTQAARDNLPNPSNFGINRQNAYLVFITKLDLDGAPMVYADGQKIRDQVFEGDSRINFRNIRGEAKFFLPVDWAFREEDRRSEEGLHEDRMLKIRKRLIHTPQGHFLLTGVKLSDLKSMPAGTVVFDPQVIPIQPGVSDGYDTLIYFKNNYQSTSTPYNYGALDNMNVFRSHFSSYHIQRSLIKFADLSSIPPGALILEGKLKLHCYEDRSLNVYPADVDVHRMLTNWDEGNNSGTTGEASWSKPTATGTWGTGGGQAGVDYQSTPDDTYTILNSSIVDSWLEWDVKDLVQDWISGSTNNYGVMVKLEQDNQSTYRLFVFEASEHSTAQNRPLLEVTYSPEVSSTYTYYIRDASGQVIATYEK